MTFEVGKRVVAESESTNRPPRTGVIEEVLRGDPSPRYRIRWDDGRESIYSPADGALRTEQHGEGATESQPDELAQYYRDEEEHIHLLE
jgi:hypothetical protein